MIDNLSQPCYTLYVARLMQQPAGGAASQGKERSVMKPELVIGLDVGTTATKCLITDLQGQVVRKAAVITG